MVLRDAGRRIATNEIVPDNFFPSGEPGIEDQWIQNQLVRLTWQVTPRTSSPRTTTAIRSSKDTRWAPAPTRRRRRRGATPDTPIYYTGQAKWTSTVTSRLLLEAGFSTNIEYLLIGYQPGMKKDRGTPELVHDDRQSRSQPGTAHPVTGYRRLGRPHDSGQRHRSRRVT